MSGSGLQAAVNTHDLVNRSQTVTGSERSYAGLTESNTGP